MIGLRLQVVGIDKVQNRAAQLQQKIDTVVKNNVDWAVFATHEKAVSRTPVDTGMLRSHIFPEIQGDGFTGVVAARSNYAQFMEFGTAVQGRQSAHPLVPTSYVYGSKHNVPAHYLAGWARRHGLDAGAVAYMIRKRRGLRARKYMAYAFQEIAPKFRERIQKEIRECISRP